MSGLEAAMPSPGGATSRRRLALLAALLIVLVATPFVLEGYALFQVAMMLVYAIGVLGLNLLMGFNGQISIGHGAFFALGAYVVAMLMAHAGWPYWATLPVAAGVCLLFGLLFGLPALRLSGVYLALSTFALALAVPQLIRYKPLVKWTGGGQGLTLDRPSPPGWVPLSADQWLYGLTLAITLLLFWWAHNLLAGRLGRAIVAIRENPLSASTMGINLPFYKTVTFGISGMYTGIAGGLSAILVQFVSPDNFDLFLSISFLVGVAVGGLGRVSGAIYGGVFIVIIPNLLAKVSTATPWAIYGAVLIGVMYVMPDGIAGLLARLEARLRQRTRGS
jgi:branched-chain amino acid transport system permease protein